MNDKELLTAFENCTLPYADWTHRAHVRVAFLYASRHNFASAVERIRDGIKRYNRATKTPEAVDRGYHETITVAFMQLVSAINSKTGPYKSSDDFCEAHPELMAKSALHRHYSRDHIMSWEAKQRFVEPNLEKLPKVSGWDASIARTLPGAIKIVEQLTNPQISQLHALIQQQWWGGRRTLDDVRTMVEHTSLMIGLVERSQDELIGYCRVLTDFVFRATIYDVMINERFQRQGLGTTIVETLCSHPRLNRVSFLYLACEPALYKFYERWGFKPYEGKAQWMVKVQREE